MHLHRHSAFKDPVAAAQYLTQWRRELETLNGCRYQRLDVATPLGNTVVWGQNLDRPELPAVVIFPGFRTLSLFWDLDHNLAPLKEHYRLFLVDVNGQPCLSDGHTPRVRSDDYGHWAAALLRGLGLRQADVLGASFGGLLALKLSQVAPELVGRVVLLNPGCLQSFSLSWRNLYYNLLPLLRPTLANVNRFLDAAVFVPGHHEPSAPARRLVAEYELFAIREFRDRTEKPYAMSAQELARVDADVHLLVGERDLLFPYEKSTSAARARLPRLRSVHVLPQTGHGIETSPQAMQVITRLLGAKAPVLA